MRRIFVFLPIAGLFTAWLVSLLYISPVVEAETRQSAAEAMGIDAVISDVLEHNAELLYYEREIDIAEGDFHTAATWSNPEISTSVGNKHISSGAGGDDGISWSLSFTQTFEWPGRIELRKLIATKQRELAEIGLSQFKAALASQTRALAYDIFAAQEKLAATREVVNRYESLMAVLKERETAGVVPLLERRIIEATAFALRRKVTDAELERNAAAFKLNELRGTPFTDELRLSPVTPHFMPPPSIDELLASARSKNFSLLLKNVEAQKQGLKVSLAKNERHPSFSVGPYFSNERAGDQETQVGIGVSVPLPLWNDNAGNIASEEARAKRAAASFHVTERELEREIFENWKAYKTKLSEMGKWKQESVKEFKAAAILADDHYRTGAVPAATYIELQHQYLEALEATLSTQRDALLARQKLELLTGVTFEGATHD